MNVLYISYDGMTDPLGQSQVLPYLVGLSEKGLKFTLLTCEKKSRFITNKSIIEGICKQSNIEWHPITYTKNPPIFSTVVDLFKMKAKAKELHKLKKFEVVHCRSYIPSLIGLELKKKFGVKFIFDMRGFWADERVDGNLWNLNNPLYRMVYNFFKKKELEFLNYSNAIISLTEAGKEEMFKWRGFSKEKKEVTVIPCCVDIDLFSEENVNMEMVNALKSKIDGEITLSYIGSIGTWYMLSEMLDFFKRLLLKKSGSKFLLITPESPQMILEKAKEKNIPEDRFFITFAKRKDIPTYISLSDYSIFFIKPTYSKMSSSPTKHAEIMSMGIPVICNSNVGDLDRILNTTETGLLINEFSDSEYDRVIDDLINKPHAKADHIRSQAESIYSLEKGIEKYYKIYSELKNSIQ